MSFPDVGLEFYLLLRQNVVGDDMQIAAGYQRKEGFTFIPSDVPPSPFRSVLLS